MKRVATVLTTISARLHSLPPSLSAPNEPSRKGRLIFEGVQAPVWGASRSLLCIRAGSEWWVSSLGL